MISTVARAPIISSGFSGQLPGRFAPFRPTLQVPAITLNSLVAPLTNSAVTAYVANKPAVAQSLLNGLYGAKPTSPVVSQQAPVAKPELKPKAEAVTPKAETVIPNASILPPSVPPKFAAAVNNDPELQAWVNSPGVMQRIAKVLQAPSTLSGETEDFQANVKKIQSIFQTIMAVPSA